MNAPKGYPCDLTGCSKEPIMDVDQCVEKFCWSSYDPIPPNPSNSIAAIITCTLSALLIVIILFFVVARKKIAAVYRRLVNNGDEDPPIGQEALQAEINEDLDGSSPIYNPTTSRGLLPPIGYNAPIGYYSALETDDEVSEEQEEQETSNRPEMNWDDRVG